MIVSDEAFEYLKWQAGDIYDLHRSRKRWEQAYTSRVRSQFYSIAPFLPMACASCLDVGSGLGGVNARLNSYYKDALSVHLLDGQNDPPETELHNRTHNDMGVAYRFLKQNGVSDIVPITKSDRPRPMDLVVSFSAWCFHFAPNEYLDFVVSCCRPETVITLDVRRNRPEWTAQLARAFVEVRTIFREEKYERKVFRLAA